MRKALLSLACIALAAATSLAGDTLERVHKAPDLSFAVPGKGMEKLSEFRGKVVALEFIFTTCPHCQAASHFMSKLQDEFGSRGLQVIDVAVNPNADLLVENFSKDMHVNFPVGWTSQDQMQTFMGFTDGRFVVPQLVLIDRQGIIHYQTPALSNDSTWEKLMNEQSIRQHIEQLLSPAASAPLPKVATVRKPS